MAVTYRQAGVDIDEASSLVDRIKPLAARTQTQHVLSGIGGFAGLCRIPPGLEEPILVSGTDGVGTKLKVAFETGRHDTIGQDLVAMCVNDVITTGAEPLFFLDYFGTGQLDASVGADVVRGIAEGCTLAGCALLGGETAELPGMYTDGEYDLAGFAVGVADRKHLLGSHLVTETDELVAVASSGLHSNGYSLARHVLQTKMGLQLDSPIERLGGPLGEVLLRPTRIYASAVQNLREALGGDLHSLCHVTGGGLPENLPRVLPDGVDAIINGARPWPAIFSLIADGGPVKLAEMRRTFNLGVGLVAVVAKDKGEEAIRSLGQAGQEAYLLGHLSEASGPAKVHYVHDPEGQRT